MKVIYKAALPFFAALLFLSACSQEIEGNMSRDVQDFSAVNQDGEKRSLEDYKGQYWVADFVFTNCDTVCPPMTANMSRLQTMMEEENIKDVQLVSFSVDPKNDTPEALKEFGNKFSADYDNWDFLTGYKFEEVRELSIKSFQSMLEDVPDSDQMSHGTRFYLVNPEGEVIKHYKGTQADSMKDILEDLKKVK
ncbi:SCO family protein [Thalassobacillus devorans]|uniref:SCO family protein n=1 Tax=Thalassobacillus devorans TaxID=279813 RepID=UPI0004909696|nr:SCO family protein [Thalassobacillus devorans]